MTTEKTFGDLFRKHFPGAAATIDDATTQARGLVSDVRKKAQEIADDPDLQAKVDGLTSGLRKGVNEKLDTAGSVVAEAKNTFEDHLGDAKARVKGVVDALRGKGPRQG